jgi:hypothetical protein
MNDFNYFDIPQFARRSKDFTPAKLQGCHAIVATPVITGAAILAPATPQLKTWTLTALDADVAVNVPHGMTAPLIAFVIPLVSYATAAIPNWASPIVGANVALAKTANAGSGGAVAGTTVIAMLVVMTPTTLME